jgi:fructose-specific phosphotransferase system IIC component
MIVRILNLVMTALFVLAVAVQYNDPDPIRWMAIYGAAGALSAWAAVRCRVPLGPVLVVGLIALIWGIWGLQIESVSGRAAFREMFQAWEMRSESVEEAREAGGLLIVAAWMTVLAIQTWLARSPHSTSRSPR